MAPAPERGAHLVISSSGRLVIVYSLADLRRWATKTRWPI